MRKKTGISGKQLAELAGVSPAAVSKATKVNQLHRNSNGLFDPDDKINADWINARSRNNRAQRKKKDHFKKPNESDQSYSELERIDLEKKIQLNHEKIIAQQLKNAIMKKDIMPIQIAKSFIESFSAGIKTNFLPISERVSRGNKILRNKIEKEIKIAIKKTLDNSAAQLRKLSTEFIYEDDDE